ncbi:MULTISPECIES: alpha/beta hydrolase [Actinoplanes]|uniref:alpha/beta fold hydrolase n=1 Tax=Actinoplanes TaxID=1865 RepID=UPI0005F2D02E|nr:MULTISPECIES: alpha/beta hydrolase [Actinoplanes]GLY02032.1 hypothetical protein Acsp01_24110 [Actinoplanes sp. NBRC 101535]
MTLNHDVTGSGPVVLLLHSTTGDRRMWDPQVPVLAGAGYRVVRCDLNGYGSTPVPTGDYNDADDVLTLLTSLGATRAAVIAASGGGRVALDLIARSPQTVPALLLIATAMRGHDPSPELSAFGDREDALLEAGDAEAATALNVDLWLGPLADDATRAKLHLMQHHAFTIQLAADAEAAAADTETTTGVDSASGAEAETDTEISDPTEASPSEASPSADLSEFTAPVLLLSGAHDLPDFRQIAAHLATVFPNARHRELDWAGHLPTLESPDRANPLILEFLAESFPIGPA